MNCNFLGIGVAREPELYGKLVLLLLTHFYELRQNKLNNLRKRYYLKNKNYQQRQTP